MPAPEDTSQSEPNHLSFQYEEADWVSAVGAHYGSRPIVDVILPLILIACGLYLWNDPRFGDYPALLLMAATVFIFLRFILPRVVFRRTKRFHQPYELIFTLDGIQFRTTDMDSQLQWSLYTRALITPKVILLYYEKRHFTTIPQRVFKNENERARFEKLLAEKIPTITRRNQ